MEWVIPVSHHHPWILMMQMGLPESVGKKSAPELLIFFFGSEEGKGHNCKLEFPFRLLNTRERLVGVQLH
jgi:hypothetical protein